MESEHNQFLEFRRLWDNSDGHITAHTSGSTGTPKPIRLPKADMAASALATCRRFGIGNTSLLWCPLSLDYIAGKMMAVRAIVSGAQLVVTPPSRQFMDACPQAPVDLLAIVPAQIEALVASPLKHQIANVIIGGAPISTAQEETLAAQPFHAYATYGMTETCSHVALRDITARHTHYEAMPGIHFSLDSDNCLIIHAPFYSFGTLATHDVVQLLSPTRFRWLGRADNVINSGGIKLHPEQIEREIAHLISHPFMLTSRPSQQWGQEMIMLIETTDITIDTATLLSTLRTRLGPHRTPKAIITTPSLPRTPNGKLRRHH